MPVYNVSIGTFWTNMYRKEYFQHFERYAHFRNVRRGYGQKDNDDAGDGCRVPI